MKIQDIRQYEDFIVITLKNDSEIFLKCNYTAQQFKSIAFQKITIKFDFDIFVFDGHDVYINGVIIPLNRLRTEQIYNQLDESLIKLIEFCNKKDLEKYGCQTGFQTTQVYQRENKQQNKQQPLKILNKEDFL